MEKILITGSAGFVGSLLYLELKQDFSVLGLDIVQSKTVDQIINLANFPQLDQIFHEYNPDIIIHTAKLAKSLDYSESHLLETYEANYIPTFNLVKLMLHTTKKMIYFSSDYLYPGISGNYKEDELPYPKNYYSLSKYLGEEICKMLSNYLILRPTVIFGWHESGMNFFMQLWRNLNQHEKIVVPSDQISNPMYIHTLIDAIKKAIKLDIRGIYNATGLDALNRYEFALKIAHKFQLDAKLIIPKTTLEIDQTAIRPLNNSTNSSKLQKALNMKFPSIDENLKHIEGIINGYKAKN